MKCMKRTVLDRYKTSIYQENRFRFVLFSITVLRCQTKSLSNLRFRYASDIPGYIVLNELHKMKCRKWVSEYEYMIIVGLTLRSALRPMRAVGVKARERKWAMGNQYQNWVKMKIPTIEGIWFCPERDCKDMLTLRPPLKSNHEILYVEKYVINKKDIASKS